MQKIVIAIQEEPVRLDHLLKEAGIAMTGGQAGQLIKQGLVTLNKQTVTEKRKKIYLKDEVIFDNEYLLELKA